MKLMLEAMDRSRQEGQSGEEPQGELNKLLPQSASPAAVLKDSSGLSGTFDGPAADNRRLRYALLGGAGITLLVGAGVFFMPTVSEPMVPPSPALLEDVTAASENSVMEVEAQVTSVASDVGHTQPDAVVSTTKDLQAEADPRPKVSTSEPKPSPTRVSGSAVLPANGSQSQVLKPVEKRVAAEPEGNAPRLVKLAPKEGVSAAWQALRDGRLDEAEALYREVLGTRPNDVDALVGLASLLHRRGEREKAWNTYRQVLAQAPDNATAISGTMALLSESDPAIAESRLKDLIEMRPNEEGLQVALGHLLGRQGRWSEAQVAFFAAFKLQPNSGINAYNLAVALDHLHQYGPALNFYRTALASAAANEIPMDSTRQRIEALNKQEAVKP